ncbi:MAG: hypothetical protein K0S45_3642 [Nitrospira sp.]|nr:hypothetical protein [Nitrospira sp.]
MTMIHREGIRFGIERKVGRALGRQWIEGSVFSENEIPRLFERFWKDPKSLKTVRSQIRASAVHE